MWNRSSIRDFLVQHGSDVVASVIALVALYISLNANGISRDSNMIAVDSSRMAIEANRVAIDANTIAVEANNIARDAVREERQRTQYEDRETWYRKALEYARSGRLDSLRYAQLQGQDLRNVDLADADLIGADLSGADLSGANLSGALLIGANLHDAVLTDVSLQRADLSATDLRSATMENAKLTNAMLNGTDLRGSRMVGADLSTAIHAVVPFTRYSCTGWNLAGSDCSTQGGGAGPLYDRGVCMCASFSSDSMNNVLYDEDTVWPSSVDISSFSAQVPIHQTKEFAYLESLLQYHLTQVQRSGLKLSEAYYLGNLGALNYLFDESRGGIRDSGAERAVSYFDRAVIILTEMDGPIPEQYRQYFDYLAYYYDSAGDSEAAADIRRTSAALDWQYLETPMEYEAISSDNGSSDP